MQFQAEKSRREDRAGNRTEPHALFEEFRKTVRASFLLGKAADELEKVTLGESKWPDVICYAQKWLEN